MKTLKITIILVLTLITIPTAGQTITLDLSKKLALKNNKTLKEAKLNLKISEKVKQHAFTKYFPKVNASAFALRSSDYLLKIRTPEMNLPIYDGNPANLATATQFAYIPPMNIQSLDYANTAIITAIQPIYTGGRIKNGNKLANLGKEVSQYQLNLSINQVLATTESYYWQLVALKEKKATLKSYEKMLLTLQKEVQDFYDAGLVTKSDLLKVKLALNKIEANKLKLDNGTELLKMVFSQHIGIPYQKTMNVNDSIISVLPPETYYIEPSLGLKNRQEYKMLNKAIDAEVLQKKMTKGEFLPELAVGAGELYLDAYKQKNNYGLAFATLSIPLSDWWGGTYKMQKHAIKIKIAKNNLDEKSELLQLQISKAYKDLINSYKQIAVAKIALKQSLEYQKELEDNYDAGLTSTSDLLDAKALAQQAKDEFIDAKSQYKIKVATYLLSVGKTTE